jgi:hypothetical protein
MRRREGTVLPRGLSGRLIFLAGLTAALLVALAAFGGLSYAASTSPGTGQYGEYERPGWGCGDANHVHTGPPGNQYGPPGNQYGSVPPGCDQYGFRPGWGCGDSNHPHTGPVGQQYGTPPPPGCIQYRIGG